MERIWKAGVRRSFDDADDDDEDRMAFADFLRTQSGSPPSSQIRKAPHMQGFPLVGAPRFELGPLVPQTHAALLADLVGTDLIALEHSVLTSFAA